MYPDPGVGWNAPRRLRGFAVAISIATLLVSAFVVAQVDPAKLVVGVPRLARWAARAWPPDVSDFSILVERALQTLAMATAGTVLATVLALTLCFLASRNLTPNPWPRYAARWTLNVLRSIDSFVFALIFVAAVGLGPFAGVLGLTLNTFGSIAKSWADGIENAEAGPLEAASLSGASRIKLISFVLVPDVLPGLASTALYFWEFNVRASTVLGVVGAGGIGQDLKNSIDLLDFPRVATIVLVILTMVTAIDHLSSLLRRRLA